MGVGLDPAGAAPMAHSRSQLSGITHAHYSAAQVANRA